jgi:MFS family permease
MVLAIAVAIMIFWRSLTQVFPAGIWVAKPGLGTALAMKFLVVFSFFGSESYIPVLLKHEFSFSPFEAGSVLTGAALTWTAATWIYERIADRVSVRTVILLGCGFMIIGMSVLIIGMTLLDVAYASYIAWALCAFGMGFAYPLTMVSAMSNTREGSEGNTATGAGMVDALGFSFSSGIGGAIVNITSAHQWPLLQSVQCIWLLMLTILMLALWVGVYRYVNTADQVTHVHT